MSNFYSINKAYAKVIKEQSEPSAMSDIVNDEEQQEMVLRLSNDIADELTKTLNSFTATCARIVKSKGATKENMQRFNNSYRKIKNLIDAAGNTNLKTPTNV